MVAHGSGPGMEDGEDGDFPSNVMRVCHKLHEGTSGRFEENVVKEFLMRAHQFMKLLWNGKHDVEVCGGNEFFLSFFDPSFGIGSVAFRTATVFT